MGVNRNRLVWLPVRYFVKMFSLLQKKFIKMPYPLTNIILHVLILTCCLTHQLNAESEDLGVSENGRFRLEGKVVNQHTPESNKDWTSGVRVLVDGGEYLGILKPDGNFAVNNIPSGSYIVEVVHPKFNFESVRVDINSKGKVRARSLNFIQPSAVNTMTYPLKIRSRGKPQYFQQRDQWRISDFVFSPMVMMMIMPLLLMFVMPKLMNSQDPETQKEMQKSMNLLTPKQNMPDMSEWLTQMFKGGSSSATAKKSASKTGKSLKKKE